MMTATMNAMLKEFLEVCSSEPALSLFLQWGKPGDYAPGHVDA